MRCSPAAVQHARPELVFYVLVRHALLEDGINDRGLADYLSALVLTFGRAAAPTTSREDNAEYRYLVDIAAAGDQSTGRGRSCCGRTWASSRCG
jgi:hypothetical protein